MRSYRYELLCPKEARTRTTKSHADSDLTITLRATTAIGGAGHVLVDAVIDVATIKPDTQPAAFAHRLKLAGINADVIE